LVPSYPAGWRSRRFQDQRRGKAVLLWRHSVKDKQQSAACPLSSHLPSRRLHKPFTAQSGFTKLPSLTADGLRPSSSFHYLTAGGSSSARLAAIKPPTGPGVQSARHETWTPIKRTPQGVPRRVVGTCLKLLFALPQLGGLDRFWTQSPRSQSVRCKSRVLQE